MESRNKDRTKQTVELQELKATPTDILRYKARKLQIDISKHLRVNYSQALDSKYQPSFFYNSSRYHHVKKPIAVHLDNYTEFDLLTLPQIAYYLNQFKSFEKMNEQSDPPGWTDNIRRKKRGGRLGDIMKTHDQDLKSIEQELYTVLNQNNSIINYKIEWCYNVLSMVMQMKFAASLSSNFNLFEISDCPDPLYYFHKFEQLEKYFTGKDNQLDLIEMLAMQRLTIANKINIQQQIQSLQEENTLVSKQKKILQEELSKLSIDQKKMIDTVAQAKNSEKKLLQENINILSIQKNSVQEKITELTSQENLLQEKQNELVMIKQLLDDDRNYSHKIEFLQKKITQLNSQKMSIDFVKKMLSHVMKEKDAPGKMKYILRRVILFDFIESLISEEKQFFWRWTIQAQYSKLTADLSPIKKATSYFNHEGHAPLLQVAQLKGSLSTLESDDYDEIMIDEIMEEYIESLQSYQNLIDSDVWKTLVKFPGCEWISYLKLHVQNNFKKPLAIMNKLVDKMENDPSYNPNSNEQIFYDLYLDLKSSLNQVEYLEAENVIETGPRFKM